jgi:hypothetical protein
MTSPFREAPHLELGPLDVGLGAAARRAVIRLPRGGRVVVVRAASADAARGGALGSAGLLFTGVTAFIAILEGFRPASADHLVAAVPLVVLAGVSLAAILRALDRAGGGVVRPGDVIGARAASVLRSLAGLEEHAHRALVDPRSIHWLRRVLVAAEDPEIAPWIPADVRGRAELLLAREIAAYRRAAFAGRIAGRGEITALLAAASEHLDDASPARADLAAIASDSRPASRKRRAPFASLALPSRG